MSRISEEEALIRAREAAAQRHNAADAKIYRSGQWDHHGLVQSAKRALLDLDKPLPVDRDLADLHELDIAITEAEGFIGSASGKREGGPRPLLIGALPAFRAIIQRRIEEAVK